MSIDSVTRCAAADIAPGLDAMVDELHHRVLPAAVEEQCPDMARAG